MKEKRTFGSVRKLPSGRFQARYTGPDGTYVTAPKTFAAKIHAETWLGDRLREIDTGLSVTIEVLVTAVAVGLFWSATWARVGAIIIGLPVGRHGHR